MGLDSNFVKVGTGTSWNGCQSRSGETCFTEFANDCQDCGTGGTGGATNGCPPNTT